MGTVFQDREVDGGVPLQSPEDITAAAARAATQHTE